MLYYREQWEEILSECDLDEVDLRDNRYNQVIHQSYFDEGKWSWGFEYSFNGNVYLISNMRLSIIGHSYDNRC